MKIKNRKKVNIEILNILYRCFSKLLIVIRNLNKYIFIEMRYINYMTNDIPNLSTRIMNRIKYSAKLTRSGFECSINCVEFNKNSNPFLFSLKFGLNSEFYKYLHEPTYVISHINYNTNNNIINNVNNIRLKLNVYKVIK